MEAATDHDVLEESWDEFIAHFRWRQGEHLTLVGPTGQGKTTLALELLPKREYTLAFITKRKDPLLSRLTKPPLNFKLIKSVDEITTESRRYALKPPFPKGMKTIRGHAAGMADEFQRALLMAYEAGGWCIYIDESLVINHYLGLSADVELLLTQGRSLGVTVVQAVQRPWKIPLATYNQPTHLFFWRDTDEDNLRRIGGFGGQSAGVVRWVVSMLGSHEVLYLNTRTGEMVVTKAPPPGS